MLRTEIGEDVGASPSPGDVKVHRVICTELNKLVKRVSEILLEIEAALPRCSSGMDALCQLSSAIDQAKSLLHNCCVSSKLYLALTGDTILARCKESRNLQEQSLSEIQKMVPILLATKVSRVIADLREATFSLDPSEEEAGKVVNKLLHLYASESDSTEEIALNAIRVVALQLDITCNKAVLIEKRSIKKLLNKLGEGERAKRKILLLFWNLLNKCGKLIIEEIEREGSICHEDMKEGCVAHRVTISVPCIWPTFHSLESSSTSIVSSSSSVNALSLPVDFINLSLGFSETSQNSETTQAQGTYGLNNILTKASDESLISHSVADAHDVDVEYLSKLDSLSWESQFNVVENLERVFKYDDQDWDFIPYQDLMPPLIRFQRHALDLHDLKAQMSGCLLWLAFIKKCRTCIPCINDDAYDLLASLIDTEVAKEAFAILEVLSCHEQGRHKIAASGALVPLLKILDSQTGESHELVLNVLCNLSEDSEVCSSLVSSDIIPKLVPFFEDPGLARYSATIARKLSCWEDARVSLAETDGCVASLARLLDSECLEDQEHAVALLLSLCSQHIKYCELVMDECVIPALSLISFNGNDKAKSMARKLLCLLREKFNDNGGSGSDLDGSMGCGNTSEGTERSSKAPRLYGKRIFRKLSIFFSKLRSLTVSSTG